MGIPPSTHQDNSYRLIPNDELNIFITKVFGSEIRLETHLDNEFEPKVVLN
jgi:hypothetical protein